MNRVFFIWLLILSTLGYSQKDLGKVILIDGTVKNGYVKITDNEIKFKENLNDKAVFYDFNQASSIVIINSDKGEVKFEYVYFDFRKTPILLKVEIEGFLTLYSDSKSYFTGSVTGFRSSSTYYLKKQNDKLGQWFLCYGYSPKITFKNVIEKYFLDCPSIQEKVSNGEFRKNDFEQIVKFYNENCVSKD